MQEKEAAKTPRSIGIFCRKEVCHETLPLQTITAAPNLNRSLSSRQMKKQKYFVPGSQK
jgi:hypothetical protein